MFPSWLSQKKWGLNTGGPRDSDLQVVLLQKSAEFSKIFMEINGLLPTMTMTTKLHFKLGATAKLTAVDRQKLAPCSPSKLVVLDGFACSQTSWFLLYMDVAPQVGKIRKKHPLEFRKK